MNILHLKYVVCIAENGSINKAAEELHVAQPNLSRVVREMGKCADNQRVYRDVLIRRKDYQLTEPENALLQNSPGPGVPAWRRKNKISAEEALLPSAGCKTSFSRIDDRLSIMIYRLYGFGNSYDRRKTGF